MLFTQFHLARRQPCFAKIEQKTDSDSLFEFSKQSFIDNGFKLEYVTDDLYSEPHEDNIPTEYETKFVSENIKIHKLIASLKEL